MKGHADLALPHAARSSGTLPRLLPAGVRLSVDLIACDGRGQCAEALPELITLDDWGFPITSARAAPVRAAGRRARDRPSLSQSSRSGSNAVDRTKEQMVPVLGDHRPCRG